MHAISLQIWEYVLLNRAIVKYLSSKSDVFVDPGKFKGEDKDTFLLKGGSLESEVTKYDIRSLSALFDIFYFKKFDYFIMSAGMSASNSKIRYFLNRTKLICILLLLKCRGVKIILPNFVRPKGSKFISAIFRTRYF